MTPAPDKRGATVGDENTGAGGDEEAGASPLPMDVFWLVYKAQKATPDGCLSISHAELAIPGHMGIQVKDAAVRAGMKNRGGVISTRVPFLTTSGELRRGDALWHHSDGGNGEICCATRQSELGQWVRGRAKIGGIAHVCAEWRY